MIWQLVAMARPYMARQCIDQFKAQRHPDKRLCIATGGPQWEGLDARQVLRDAGGEPDLLITGKDTKAEALDCAVDELRKLDADILVRDDDDYYTPESMSEFVELLPKWDFVGQYRHWVSMGGKLWLFDRPRDCEMPDGLLWGGNFAFRSRDCMVFGRHPISQCQQWATAMLKAGARGWHKSRNGGCLMRGHVDHLWQADDAMVQFMSGDAWVFDMDPDLISGKRPAEGGFFIQKPSLDEAIEAEVARMQRAVGY